LIELAKFIERMVLAKNKDLIYKLLTEVWQEFFGTLDYSPSNYDPESGQFKNRFLGFLETGSQQLLPKPDVTVEFVHLVRMRQRANFLFEFVLVHHFNEESQMFVMSVNSGMTRL
jgi:hypothetical protein